VKGPRYHPLGPARSGEYAYPFAEVAERDARRLATTCWLFRNVDIDGELLSVGLRRSGGNWPGPQAGATPWLQASLGSPIRPHSEFASSHQEPAAHPRP
jgi:hypothetical protein